ncbi:MAG: sugar phosphate isomerase/epimerase [Sphingomonadales bacterium]|nr:sugar phosphate isomerase/epimerase [Sphingomonadales bacterium]
MSRPTLAKPHRFFSPNGIRIGLQLYTLGDEWVKDTSGTFAELARIGVRDLELPGLMGKSATELRAEADHAGLFFSSFHLPARPLFGPGLSLQSGAGEIADMLGLLGAHDVVVPLPPLPDDFAFVPGKTGPADLAAAVAAGGGDAWKRFAARLNEQAAALAAHGITLGYHNHNVEFAAVGKTTPWAILLAETDPARVFFELDLGWISAAGRDPVAEIRRLGQRVRWLHIKDVKATTKRNYALQMDPAVVGEGRQNWPAILRAAAVAGVQHYYIEQEPPFAIARMEAVRRGSAYLAGLTT